MGRNCTEEYDACSFHPCQNNASCTSLKRQRSYNCACLLGFNGTNCENNIDDCLGVTCERYHVCFDGIHNYTCACPRGMFSWINVWHSKMCDISTSLITCTYVYVCVHVCVCALLSHSLVLLLSVSLSHNPYHILLFSLYICCHFLVSLPYSFPVAYVFHFSPPFSLIHSLTPGWA